MRNRQHLYQTGYTIIEVLFIVVLTLIVFSIVSLKLRHVQPVSQIGPVPSPVRTQRLYHWSDGRVGYQDNSGLWWYYMLSQPSQTTTVVNNTYRSGNSTGSWSQGSAPTPTEVKNAQPEQAKIQETSNGQPASAPYEEQAAPQAAPAADQPAPAAVQPEIDHDRPVDDQGNTTREPEVDHAQPEVEQAAPETAQEAPDNATSGNDTSSSSSSSSDSGSSSGGDSGGSGGGGE